MRVTGVIAEFNPFHNGHSYLLQKARKITNADLVIVVLSGAFVQRGAPALLSKYARAKAALSCGADLVVELPVFASCASAQYFAQGALRLLCDLKADSFVFGSETGELAPLLTLSKLLCEEPSEYKCALKAFLASGSSFPAARKQAVASLMPEAASLLDMPNNLLGLAYLSARQKEGYSIEPYTILRQGANYHEQELSSEFPSAAALRTFLEEHQTVAPLAPFLPAPAYQILKEEFSSRTFVTERDLSPLLTLKLLQCENAGELQKFADISPALANRIFKNRYQNISFPEFSMLLKTRELTLTRIYRALLHFILDITDKEQKEFFAPAHSPYARILGLRSAARALLRERKNSIPLILRPAQGKKMLSPQAYHFFQKDIACAELYRQLSFQKSGITCKSEFTHEILFLE